MEEYPLRILLVEDNPADARLLREMLAEVPSTGTELTHVDRVASGLEILAARQFDLVLLDLSLPDSFGFEGFVKIHAAVPFMPVVILTNFDNEDIALRAVQEGAQDYLVKGQIDGQRLVRAARYAVERGRRTANSISRVEETIVNSALSPVATSMNAVSLQPDTIPGRLRGDELPIGQQLDNYRITGRLGQGGMGVVYEAENVMLYRSAAIKLLPDLLASDPWALKLFLREARAAAQIDHPNVVGIYDIGQWNGTYFIAMELVRGASIQRHLSTNGPLNWQEATRVAADACRGLSAAHAAGLVHRDIKPDNILLGNDGSVKIADFGLAQVAESLDTNRGSVGLSGAVVGTVHYMSPEQCRGERVSPQSDIYSLGVTYYAMLCGRPPFTGDNARIVYGHCFGNAPELRTVQPDVPEECAAVARRAMARDPQNRYESAETMAAALTDVLSFARLAHG